MPKRTHTEYLNLIAGATWCSMLQGKGFFCLTVDIFPLGTVLLSALFSGELCCLAALMLLLSPSAKSSYLTGVDCGVEVVLHGGDGCGGLGGDWVGGGGRGGGRCEDRCGRLALGWLIWPGSPLRVSEAGGCRLVYGL